MVMGKCLKSCYFCDLLNHRSSNMSYSAFSLSLHKQVPNHCTSIGIPIVLTEELHMPNIAVHSTMMQSVVVFFKETLDNFRTIRSVYLCSDCMLNLTCKFKLITKICEFFLQLPFLKVYF